MFANARRSLFVSLVLGSSVFAGCSPFVGDDDVVGGKVDVVKQAGTLKFSGVTAINGSYGSACEGRSAGDKWSAAVDSNATLANDELKVRKNDSDCALTLTEIVTDEGTFAADAAIALGTSYAFKPARFASSTSSFEFFGNARLDSASFAADFTISLSVAMKAFDAESGEKTSTYATHSASVSVANVPAPTYSIDLADFALTTDANDMVVSSSGHAQLTAGSTEGQTFAIHEGTLTAASTPSEIHDAMVAATASGPLSGLTSLQIPHSQFALEGKSLSKSVERTIIIRNLDDASKVASYQLIAVTFKSPAQVH